MTANHFTSHSDLPIYRLLSVKSTVSKDLQHSTLPLKHCGNISLRELESSSLYLKFLHKSRKQVISLKIFGFVRTSRCKLNELWCLDESERQIQKTCQLS